ncbi:MAG: TatD family hydrolase [Marinilabiliaceae bacterium]
MIDTHAHIYLPEFDKDRATIVEKAKEEGIEKILMPNIDNSSIRPMLDTESSYPGVCHAMMGLHPTSVKGDYTEQLNIIERWLGERDFIAIGEIGIDLYWDQTWEREQREVFRTQLKWAKELGKPVAIHVRNAFEAIFEELDKVHDHRLKGVFHSFSGSHEDLRRALEYPGFMLGINGIVTFKNAGLDKVLASTTPERIITETDAPFLAPVPYRGKRNQPAYMKHTLEKLAEIFGISTEEADRITTRNARSLFPKVDQDGNE